jgi:hypothetical protein
MKLKLTMQELRDLKAHRLCQMLNTEQLRPSATESLALRESIGQHGVSARIVIDEESGQVLDGWNTLKEWITVNGHGKMDNEIDWSILDHIDLREFSSDKQRISYVLGAQLGRRNLTAVQRAALAKAFLQARDGSHPGPSVESVAKSSSTSRSTVLSLNRIDREAAPELAKAVRDGTIPMQSAEKLLPLSKAQQAEIVAGGPEAVKAAVAPGYGKRNVSAVLGQMGADLAQRGVPLPSSEAVAASLVEGMSGGAPHKDAPASPVGASREERVAHANSVNKALQKDFGDEALESALIGTKDPAERGWRADKGEGRKRMVWDHAAEIGQMLRDRMLRNGTEARDEAKILQLAQQLNRQMPHHKIVDELYREALKPSG